MKMMIKVTVMLNIEPIESDVVEGDEQATLEACVNGFFECAHVQCEWNGTRCEAMGDCKGCTGYKVLKVERIEKEGELNDK